MKSQLLLSLVVILASSAINAQAQFGGCFSNSDCTGSVNATTAEDCCVNNPDGMYFTYKAGQCLQCIVYGWGASSFTRREGPWPQDIPLAYFKGPSDVSLIIDVVDTGLGSAERGVDYIENDNGAQILSLDPTATASITFRADNIALEPDETIMFDLNVLAVNPPARAAELDPALPNVFLQKQAVLSIQDTTELVFWLREPSREVDEDSGAVPVRVSGGQRPLDLASTISLLLTPKVAQPDFTPQPYTLRFARANTYPGRLDFSPQPIIVTFPVGRTRNVVVDVPIIDDDINEALEYFIVELSFADPDSVPDTVSIGRNVTRCDDDIFIGFQLPDTTYPEVESSYHVTLIKGANNVTEQEIRAVVILIQTIPPGSGFDFITHSDGNRDNDLSFGTHRYILISFPPDINETIVSLNIFPDDLPENTEAAQLTIEAHTEDIIIGVTPEGDRKTIKLPRFDLLPQFPNFFIIIPDDDRYRVGFEKLSYTVNETVGFQEVCLRMFEPSDYTPITGNFLVAVEAVADTADESDYTAMSGFSAFVHFNDATRRSCVNIMIADDNVYENKERFFLRLADLGGYFALPDKFVLTPNTSEIIIQDSEVVTVGFIDPPYSAREDEGPMIFTVGVTSGHTLDRDIELSFSTADIGFGGMFAIGGVDYEIVSHMMFTLTPGMMTVQIEVELVNDALFTPQNEIFSGEVTLVNGPGVEVNVDIANATIIEDEIACQELELLRNGVIVYSPYTTAPYLEGTNAEHICNPGFSLIGNVIRVCQNDSTFSGEPPVCTPIQCPALPEFPNGFITYADDIEVDNIIGTLATYECKDGFSLVGDDERNCTEGEAGSAVGVWTGTEPTCVPVKCPPLPGVANGVIFYAPDVTPNYDLGTIALYICNEGFVLDFSVQGSSATRECIDDNNNDAEGVFNRAAPKCGIASLGISAPREVRKSCLGFATILRWRPPSQVVGVISKYEIKFSVPGATFYENGDQRFHAFQPNMFGSKVTVQVRAHTVPGIVGRWSDPLEIGC